MEEDTQWHSTNAGQDTRPVVWKLEGNEILAVAGSVVLSICLFRLLVSSWELSISLALSIALCPTAFCIVFILKFVSGKPRTYAIDYVSWKLAKLRQHIGLNPSPLIAKQQNSEHEI